MATASLSPARDSEKMPEENYHLRRKEKAIKDAAELLEILSQQCVVTVAMCKDDRPYLVSLNYFFDPKKNSLYFHCASEGKKLDYLTANNSVWGQVLEDNGYISGECDYAYRTVHFKGRTRQVTSLTEKRRALELLIEKMERDPDKAKREHIKGDSLDRVAIYRIDIEEMTGKKRAR